MDGNELIVIEGTVQAIIFQNPENGYTVLRLRVGDESVTAVGTLPGLAPGEGLRLYGSWTTHASFGQQFKAEHAERSLPEGSSAIYEYLAGGAIKGVGPKLARQIVSEFGPRTLEVIETSPEELTKIKGITDKKARDIGERFRQQTGMRRLMEFLADNGVKPIAAARLYRTYGEEAEQVITENPYILADEYFGLDFFAADEFARKLDFTADAPERVEAAIRFEMRHNEGNGHVFLPVDKLTAATAQLISVEPDSVERGLASLVERGDAVAQTVAGVEGLYLADLYEAERHVALRIGEMVRRRVDKVQGLQILMERAEYACGITFAKKQREALEAAANGRVMVLTGGPGTGKTTTVRGILGLYDEMGIKTLLTAPTGRAAKRLTELTGREAQTVHRLLGAGMPESGLGTVFEKCASDMLECDAVILDETSMVDIRLMAALLDAMPPDSRLIMVGDADQLPSVGPGNVFGDVIRSAVVPVIALTDIFRQAKESAIVKNAHMINKGVTPELKNAGGDFFFLRRPDAASVTATVTELISSRLPKNMGVPPEDIQVLAPSRKYAGGARELNAAIQEALNPPSEDKKEKTVGNITFRVGDRVMQTRNNYDIIWVKSSSPEEDKSRADAVAASTQERESETRRHEAGTGIFNGDVGYIEGMDESIAYIRFDDRLVPYPFDQMTDLELAYAVTVHKSQGSEYRAVILALPKCPPGLVNRSLLYTAVTRARELLIAVGGADVFAAMVANDRRQRRYSGLRARLCGEVS